MDDKSMFMTHNIKDRKKSGLEDLLEEDA